MQIGIVLHQGIEIRQDLEGAVDLAGNQRIDDGLLIAADIDELDAIEIGPLAPIAGLRLQHRIARDIELLEREGAGAGRPVRTRPSLPDRASRPDNGRDAQAPRAAGLSD